MKLQDLFEDEKDIMYELSIFKMPKRGEANKRIYKRIYKEPVKLPAMSWRQWRHMAQANATLDLENLHDTPIQAAKKSANPIRTLIDIAKQQVPNENLEFTGGSEDFVDAFILNLVGKNAWYRLRLRLA